MAAEIPVLTVHVQTLLLRARAAGLDESAILAGLDIDPGLIAQAVAPVPLGTFDTVLERCVAGTGDPLFAVNAAIASTGEEYGLGYYAHVAATDLRKSIQNGVELWERMANPFHARFEESPGGGRVALTPIRNAPQAAESYTEMLLGLVLAACRQSARLTLVPQTVQFAHAPRAAEAAYEETFGTAVSFGAADSAITFTDAVLSRPNPSADEHLFHLARSDILRQTASNYTEGMDVIALVQASLGAAQGTEDWRLETVAERHRVPVRTLQHRLMQAGTTFAVLADAARRAKSLGLLREAYSLDEVSFRLGYTSQNGFRKAFFRWFGTTPGQWRQREVPGNAQPAN